MRSSYGRGFEFFHQYTFAVLVEHSISLKQVSTLQKKTVDAEKTLKELRSTFDGTYDDITQQLEKLYVDRENNQRELNRWVRR